MTEILIIEDELAVSELIRTNLIRKGYRCTCAYDGQRAAKMLEVQRFDLVVLNIVLPKYNGYELLKHICGRGIPVILVTALDNVNQKIKAFQLGADDYLVKPFEMEELLARVEAVLRRYGQESRVLTVEDVRIDVESRTVFRGDREIQLTLKEFELLLLFVRNQNIALFRETIFQKIWDTDYFGDTRTLDLHVHRLRKKLGWEQRIKAVYKVGYRLEV